MPGAIVTRSATGGASTSLALAARLALASNIQQAFLVTFEGSVAMLLVTLFLKDVAAAGYFL